MSEFPIVFENEEIIIIYKPYGCAVQGGAGVKHSLDEALSLQVGYRIHLVHRLDKETSGLLVVAKSPRAAAKWTGLIGGGSVVKEYMCVSVGHAPGRSGTITGTVSAHGKERSASLHYTELAAADVPSPEAGTIPLSLLGVTLGTGRMHQIRIQMAGSGMPVAGDDRHGDFRANKALRRLGIRKLCLAAVRLTVPVDGGRRVFEAPLPGHMEAVVRDYFSAREITPPPAITPSM